MGQSPRTRKRRIHIPETEREYWRRVFFDEVHSRTRVKNIIEQDLKPLWRRTGHEVRSRSDLSDWEQVKLWDRIFAGEIRLPSQVAYEDEVNRIAQEVLRCRQDGHAAEWVVAYLHGAVQERLPDGPFLPDPNEPLPQQVSGQKKDEDVRVWANIGTRPLFDVQVNVEVGHYGAKITVASLDIASNRPLFPTLDRSVEDTTGRWDDWELLKKSAHGALSACLRWMQEEYQQRNPGSLNVSADERLLEDAKCLATYLVDRKRLSKEPARIQRLRRFASRVGLDFPVS